MTTWDLNETRTQITRLFGRRQAEFANDCLQSVLKRREYARYHYHEALALLDQLIETSLAEQSLMEVICSNDDGLQVSVDTYLTKIGAHVLACVQSLHSIGDILAHAVYFSFAFNLGKSALDDSKISLMSVLKILKTEAKCDALTSLLNRLLEDGQFRHLSALANHGKHRSIIQPALWQDATGMAAEVYSLDFSAFTYKKTDFAKRSVRPFLVSEFDRISALVVDSGNVLNRILRAEKLKVTTSVA